MFEKAIMLKNITLILNVFALVISISPVAVNAFFAIKYPEAVSVGIIGGDDGLITDILAFLFAPTSITPLIFLTILLSLNIYVIRKN